MSRTARPNLPKPRQLGRSKVLQRLIDTTPDAHHLEINIQSGHCYAIAVIDDDYDEVAVLEGDDLSDAESNAGERICRGLENGAYAWPGTVTDG